MDNKINVTSAFFINQGIFVRIVKEPARDIGSLYIIQCKGMENIA